MTEKTYAMIKPDAIKAKNIGKIIDMVEQNGFTIVRMEKTKLNREKAEKFYSVHKEKPFFKEFIDFIISGPVIAMVLEKDNAIDAWRELMGTTDSKKAAPGTIRQQFGTDIMINAVHGSDSPETAQKELQFIFSDL